MRFILFTEGQTERKSLPPFLKRWLDPQLTHPVGINPVDLHGWRGFVKDSPQKAALHLNDPKTIAVIGLIDLYGPTFYPTSCGSGAQARCDWAKQHLESRVGLERYHQFFAIHEVEAWLLSDPTIFPTKVSKKLKALDKEPETINHTKPPAKLLEEWYQLTSRRSYRKIVDGKSLFEKLDPNIAYEKCPQLKSMLDCMLRLAREYQGPNG